VRRSAAPTPPPILLDALLSKSLSGGSYAIASQLSTPHTHEREPVLPGGWWAVWCTRRPTHPRPPAGSQRPPTQARAGCRVRMGVRRACPGPNLASLAAPQSRKEPRIGRFSAGPARLPPRWSVSRPAGITIVCPENGTGFRKSAGFKLKAMAPQHLIGHARTSSACNHPTSPAKYAWAGTSCEYI